MLPGRRIAGLECRITSSRPCVTVGDEEGDSCAVWLDSGTFNDTNPPAEHVKGSPVDLWKALFGGMSFRDVLKGMERWMKDGTLPDGSKGRPTKTTSSKKRNLSERREELLQQHRTPK